MLFTENQLESILYGANTPHAVANIYYNENMDSILEGYNYITGFDAVFKELNKQVKEYAHFKYAKEKSSERLDLVKEGLKVSMELEKILNATIEELNEAYMYSSLYEYIDEALEVEYTMNLRGELRGVKILVCFGDSNVYINTRTAKVEGDENGNHLEVNLPFDVLREIEDAVISMI